MLVLVLITPTSAYSGAIADKQKKQVQASLEAHQDAMTKVVTDITKQPEAAQDQACLDDLMALDFSVFAVDPSGIWQGILDKLLAQLMAMACAAATTAYNDAISAIALDVQLPYDLGGINISTTSGDWGVADPATLELPAGDLDAYSATVEDLGISNTNAPDAEVWGGNSIATPPAWSKTPDSLSTDDVKKALDDQFF